MNVIIKQGTNGSKRHKNIDNIRIYKKKQPLLIYIDPHCKVNDIVPEEVSVSCTFHVGNIEGGSWLMVRYWTSTNHNLLV